MQVISLLPSLPKNHLEGEVKNPKIWPLLRFCLMGKFKLGV